MATCQELKRKSEEIARSNSEAEKANLGMDRKKLKAGLWFDIAKMATILMHNGVECSLKLVLAPEVMGLLYLGRCAANLGAGITGFGKTYAQVRYNEEYYQPS